MFNSFIFRLMLFVAVLVAGVWLARQYLVTAKVRPTGNVEQSGGAEAELQSWLADLTPDNSASDEDSSVSQEKDQFEKSDANSNTGSLYKWVDDQGKTQFTKTPPTDRQFTEITYEQSKSTSKPQSWLKRQPTFQQPQVEQPRTAQSTRKNNSTNYEVPVRCRVKLRAVDRLSKKLDKADDIVQSIWLQDYCTALSELIQDGCVVPKSEIKYNRYCPVRYK